MLYSQTIAKCLTYLEKEESKRVVEGHPKGGRSSIAKLVTSMIVKINQADSEFFSSRNMAYRLEQFLPLFGEFVQKTEAVRYDRTHACCESEKQGCFACLLLDFIGQNNASLVLSAACACVEIFTRETALRILEKGYTPQHAWSYNFVQSLLQLRSPIVLDIGMREVYLQTSVLPQCQTEVPFDLIYHKVPTNRELDSTEGKPDQRKQPYSKDLLAVQEIVRNMGGVFYAVNYLRQKYEVDGKSENKETFLPPAAVDCEKDIESLQDIRSLLSLVKNPSVPPWVRVWAIHQLGRSDSFEIMSGEPEANVVCDVLLDVFDPTSLTKPWGVSKHMCVYVMSRWAMRVLVSMVECRIVEREDLRTAILSMLNTDESVLRPRKTTHKSFCALQHAAVDAAKKHLCHKHFWPTSVRETVSNCPTETNLVHEAELWYVWTLLTANLVDYGQTQAILVQLNNPLFQVRADLEGMGCMKTFRNYVLHSFAHLWRPGTRVSWMLQGEMRDFHARTLNKFCIKDSILSTCWISLSHLEELLSQFPVTKCNPLDLNSLFWRYILKCRDQQFCFLDVSAVGPFARVSGQKAKFRPTDLVAIIGSGSKVASISSTMMVETLKKFCVACHLWQCSDDALEVRLFDQSDWKSALVIYSADISSE